MIVVNESCWSTEDLEALLERIAGIAGIKKGFHNRDDTLLLFKTSRRRTPRSGDPRDRVEAARADISPEGYDRTVIVEIRSGNKLKGEVLDRLADLPEDGYRDMSSQDMLDLGRALVVAWTGSWYRAVSHYDLDWVKDCTMRLRSKITRHKIVFDRQIAALERDKDRIRMHLMAEMEKLDERIDVLAAKRDKL